MDEWEDIEVRRPRAKTSFDVSIDPSLGERGNIFRDAPALAIQRQIPGVKWAMVGWGYATTGQRDGSKRYWWVEEWHAFVAWMRAYDYDCQPPVAVFTFTLDNQVDEKKTPANFKPRRQRTFFEEQARKKK